LEFFPACERKEKKRRKANNYESKRRNKLNNETNVLKSEEELNKESKIDE
jgi:hypothetical protein